MKFIKEKKISSIIMVVALYISFCACFWYTSRGSMAYMTLAGLGSVQTMFMTNEVAAFFIGGLLPIAIFEMITSFLFRFVQARIGAVADDMRYTLRFFYIPANLVAFGIKMLYLLSPIAAIYGNIIIDFIVGIGFVAWYLFYCAKHYVEKERWGAMLYQLGGAFLMYYGIITAFSLISGVI